MKEALKEARRGLGRVHPNPLVGALLVKNNRVISRGFHEAYGESHAEVHAIRSAGERAKGATLYTTLEPCTHYGKTAPCTSLILKSGIREVVIGCSDSNPDVSGKGAALLKKNGVRVTRNILKDEALSLNKSFFYWSRHKMPYVIVKAAQSIDGKIATRFKESKWITGEQARHFGQKLRSESDAVLIGINTALKDDPRLDVRLKDYKGEQPYKIVLDSTLKLTPSLALFGGTPRNKIIVATTSRSTRAKRQKLSEDAIVIAAKEEKGRVDLKDLFMKLARLGVTQILIEGGGEVIANALQKKLVNECYFFIAPIVIGGKESVGSVGGSGIDRLKQAYRFKKVSTQMLGSDLMIHGEF